MQERFSGGSCCLYFWFSLRIMMEFVFAGPTIVIDLPEGRVMESAFGFIALLDFRTKFCSSNQKRQTDHRKSNCLSMYKAALVGGLLCAVVCSGYKVKSTLES